MPRQRDPLSVMYDDFSARFLAICLADPYGWHTATVRSPARDPIDPRGLSAHERAVIRSLYYNLNSAGSEGPLGGRWVKNRDWSLELDGGPNQDGWAAPVYGGGVLGRLFGTGERTRILAARIVRGPDAAANWPRYRTYTVDPAEQSQNLAL